MKNKITTLLLKFLLKNTWHLCVHDFVCKAIPVGINLKEGAEFLCKKCGVASKIYNGRNVIFVNPKTNYPFKLDVWQLDEKDCKGIIIQENI
mgnify:FL=1